jgi:hypothetical protein
MWQSTRLVPRERSASPITNGQIGFVRRHAAARQAKREANMVHIRDPGLAKSASARERSSMAPSAAAQPTLHLGMGAHDAGETQ